MFALERKKLPLGVADFQKAIQGQYLYMDKTSFIEEIMKDGAEVKLFTRPRRFGKTLNMSMLQYFFDIQNQEENAKLFQGLEIEHSPYMAEQGKYPVIFVTFKDIKERNWKDCFTQIKRLLSNLYNELERIRSSLNPKELKNFDKIWFEEENGDYQNALKMLSFFLKKYYQIKVIILIDEYDTPIVSAYEHGYYEEAISFFR
ncbi:AAA family ATPase, partial [Fusobacterium necrophorum]|uniref:AAA family ATPase n=1 Tax=Fusobacterium necrophorum TaxID=859 RepID=UPI00055C1A42